MDPQGSSKIRIIADADLKALMPNFLKRRAEEVEFILRAAKARDFKTLQTIGHQMIGSGAGYGFDYITELGSIIEAEAMAKRPEKFPELAEKLRDYLSRVEVVFE